MENKRPRIHQRIILFLFASVILIMTVYGFISYQMNLSKEVRLMNEETNRVMQRLSSQLSVPFWNLDRRTVHNILIQEVKNPYLSGIAILIEDLLWLGVILNDKDEIITVDGRVKNDFRRLPEREGPKNKIIYKDQGDKIWEIGEVVLYTTDRPIKNSLNFILLQTILQTILLIVILSVLIVIVLNFQLRKPLQQITNTAERIGNGEIELQAEVEGPREIATLATAFNNMTARLRESLNELDRYFTYALDLLCICDTDGCFRRLNKEWEAALGFSIEELIGTRFLDYVHPEDKESTVKAFTGLISKEEVLNFVNRYQHKDGTYRWIEWRSFPYGDLIYAVARDITNRILREEEILQMNELLEKRVAERTVQLEETNKELESFSYSVSHDLRAPLRHISGFITLLESEYSSALDEKGKHYLEVISGASQRMGVLIDHLLQLSRTGRQEIKKSYINFNSLISEVIQDFNEEISGREITWEIESLPEINADYSMLRSVITNLIGNAVKFTKIRERALIHIGFFENEKNETVFFIRDNGAGFDMRYKDKLFGVFQRLHSADEFEGTGIGLASVQRIIQRHGGRIWAEGEVGKGAIFNFTFYHNQV
ncbi:MAG: PAS domain S-box protein [Spirochaetes bacterium]|nr:PAS domain S-box protein [Spirochaetota bacterium]